MIVSTSALTDTYSCNKIGDSISSGPKSVNVSKRSVRVEAAANPSDTDFPFQIVHPNLSEPNRFTSTKIVIFLAETDCFRLSLGLSASASKHQARHKRAVCVS